MSESTIATLTDEAAGVVRAALRAVDESTATLEKHKANLERVLRKLENKQAAERAGREIGEADG